jgi:nitrilase
MAAVIQMNAREDLKANLTEAERLVREAVSKGAELAVLPENFAYCGPDPGKLEHAEDLEGDGPIMTMARKLAAELNLHLIVGGVPERTDDPRKVHNTSALIRPDGTATGVYRKMHLFGVSLPGRAGISESDTMKPGDEVVVADTPWGPMGMSICYDLRFPELYRLMVERGARILAVPAAFTDLTGKAHWELLVRARAVENLCFVVAANLWGHHFGDRASWGHSLIVDPWGDVLARMDEGAGVAVARLDPEQIENRRQILPALDNRRLGVTPPEKTG